MIKIYHYPKCRKSRTGLQYLSSKTNQFQVIEYIGGTFSEKDLKDLLVKMNARPFDLVRTSEEMYRTELKGQEFTDEEWIKILVKNTRLIKRPIVVKDYKAVIADPPEKMDILFK